MERSPLEAVAPHGRGTIRCEPVAPVPRERLDPEVLLAQLRAAVGSGYVLTQSRRHALFSTHSSRQGQAPISSARMMKAPRPFFIVSPPPEQLFDTVPFMMTTYLTSVHLILHCAGTTTIGSKSCRRG